MQYVLLRIHIAFSPLAVRPIKYRPVHLQLPGRSSSDLLREFRKFMALFRHRTVPVFRCFLTPFFQIEAADLQMLKQIKKNKKITVNTGQVMFSGEIYYYWPLNSVDKIVGKTFAIDLFSIVILPKQPRTYFFRSPLSRFQIFYHFTPPTRPSKSRIHKVKSWTRHWLYIAYLCPKDVSSLCIVKIGSHIYAMWKVMNGLRLPKLMGKVTPVFLWWNALFP